MPFKKDHVVTFHYSVSDSDGKLIDSSYEQEPLSFLSGHGQIIPKLEETLSHMLVNAKKQITLPPADAYGEYKEKHVQTISRKELPADLDIKAGSELWLKTDKNEIPCFVRSIDEDSVTLDFNHPLAGKTLKFEVELLDVRPATDEELSHGHSHGPGGHHH
ncbi:peptidylprolyl isomerase [candidate division KSB1 bacterium]|nr:peptidylprolyl isomerase [candidate division KSB1 bacterium]